MTFKHKIKIAALALMLAGTPLAYAEKAKAAAPTVTQQTFASPEAAAKALAEALRAQDSKVILAIVGQKASAWVSSGDKVADRADQQKFLAAYDARNSIVPATDGRAFLLVGTDEWPFPAPLVRKGNAWVFDAAAGRDELLNRRIGRNELDTIQTLLAIVDAQREYAAGDPDGNGFNDYARRFVSSAGKKDGLYWPVAAGESQSPLGPMIGAAAREGYGKSKPASAKPAAYHGYHYRILTSQGVNAPGGAYSYLVNDKLIGGFAVLAYPAKYGVSGVMTFLVNHEGVVYQKNLGKETEAVAGKMRSFSPDSGWKKAQ
jgi:hypothetical protein